MQGPSDQQDHDYGGHHAGPAEQVATDGEDDDRGKGHGDAGHGGPGGLVGLHSHIQRYDPITHQPGRSRTDEAGILIDQTGARLAARHRSRDIPEVSQRACTATSARRHSSHTSSGTGRQSSGVFSHSVRVVS